MSTFSLRALALATAATAALAVPAEAVEEQTFKVTQVFATTHWHMTHGIQPFVDAVTEASDGKIKFEVYSAGQLGKESTTIVSSGLAQLGLLVPSYETEKLPLTSVTELPGFHSTACEGTRQLLSLVKPGGLLDEVEYAPLGVRVLYGVIMPPYEVETNTRVVESVADMSGIKLRANGAMAKAVAALGGVPVQVTSNEFYDALARGTVDGGMWPTGSTRLVGVEDVLNHTVKGTQMGAGATVFTISQKVWDGLDAETQQILTDAGEKVTASLCGYLDEVHATEEKWLVENGKLTLHQLSPDEQALWAEKVSSVATEWAADMDSTGRPGTQLLEAYKAAADAM